MDYLEIVLNGFANPKLELLENYFFREFKKAEKEHFEASEFFKGCVKAIEALESEMDKRLYKKIEQLNSIINRAVTGKVSISEKDTLKKKEQLKRETIELCETELAGLTRENFPVNLFLFTSTRFKGEFREGDAILIRNAINKAHFKTLGLQDKIYYFNEQKRNIPFRALYHTLTNVCELLKPISPRIQPFKYLDYFFEQIDFENIIDNTNKTENLKNCNTIYYGLEQIFKADIDADILNYQNGISKLSRLQIQETQLKLIELIGNLKMQTRTSEGGTSFTQRYNLLYKSIESKEKLFPIDYQILIANFNDTIVNDLLRSFEIINETFKEIIPLMQAVAIQPAETKTNKFKAPVLGLFCGLVHRIGIDKKEETESATVYCERICNKFKLPYTDRVRQNYNVNETKKLIQELTEKVLPLIDNETKILIEKYLDSKQPPKQRLYA